MSLGCLGLALSCHECQVNRRRAAMTTRRSEMAQFLRFLHTIRTEPRVGYRMTNVETATG